MRGDVDAYTAGRCGHLSAASTGRRLSVLSSWYSYLASNGVTAANPVQAVDRPDVDRDTSPTVGLSAAEATAFMRAARTGKGRTGEPGRRPPCDAGRVGPARR